jgi:hypothetical protein
MMIIKYVDEKVMLKNFGDDYNEMFDLFFGLIGASKCFCY